MVKMIGTYMDGRKAPGIIVANKDNPFVLAGHCEGLLSLTCAVALRRYSDNISTGVLFKSMVG